MQVQSAHITKLEIPVVILTKIPLLPQKEKIPPHQDSNKTILLPHFRS